MTRAGSASCDSQTMNRSFISSPLSLHHAQLLRTARSVFSGVLGMCGRISTRSRRAGHDSQLAGIQYLAVPDDDKGLVFEDLSVEDTAVVRRGHDHFAVGQHLRRLHVSG